METEQQLLLAIRNGDREAMRRLYDRFSGYTMAIALRYIPQREDAKDVLQDSFVRILTSISEFNYHGEGSLKGWVARIVANRSIDWIKEHERSLLYTSEIPETAEEEIPDLDEVPPEILNQMIGRLPAGCRMVLNLHVFERLSHKEIAQRLGIREDSSASQFFRAKKLLKEMIQDYIIIQRR